MSNRTVEQTLNKDQTLMVLDILRRISPPLIGGVLIFVLHKFLDVNIWVATSIGLGFALAEWFTFSYLIRVFEAKSDY